MKAETLFGSLGPRDRRTTNLLGARERPWLAKLRRGAVPTPRWAVEMTARVCEREGVDGPELLWQVPVRTVRSWSQTDLWGRQAPLIEKRLHGGASGTTWPTEGLCLVRAGRDEEDNRYVLLHGLAHHIAGPGHSHDRVWAGILVRIIAAEEPELLEYGTRRGEYQSYAQALEAHRFAADHPSLFGRL